MITEANILVLRNRLLMLTCAPDIHNKSINEKAVTALNRGITKEFDLNENNFYIKLEVVNPKSTYVVEFSGQMDSKIINVDVEGKKTQYFKVLSTLDKLLLN